MTDTPQITVPADLLPADGRFGSGPSLVPQSALDALAATGTSFMGTSHRQPAVKDVVGRLRDGMSTFFSLPDDWEILLGNGGSTLFWDAMTFGMIEQRSHHFVFGEFSSKFAKATAAAPHIDEPSVVSADYGTHPELAAADGVDLYALTHNETSTAVSMPVGRPAGTSASEALVTVDATSAAGGLRWDPSECDVYYFAPQKCFGSDGGLWIAACAPTAVERIEQIAASDRWVPAGLDLKIALDNSVKNQTYNTPALATVFLTVAQVESFNEQGGLTWAADRCDQSAEIIYSWAEAHELAEPFVTDATKRSTVNASIDFAETVDAGMLAKVLRQNGIVDTEGYRKLGRNQLRISLFPAINPEDVRQLTRTIDHILESL